MNALDKLKRTNISDVFYFSANSFRFLDTLYNDYSGWRLKVPDHKIHKYIKSLNIVNGIYLNNKRGININVGYPNLRDVVEIYAGASFAQIESDIIKIYMLEFAADFNIKNLNFDLCHILIGHKLEKEHECNNSYKSKFY